MKKKSNESIDRITIRRNKKYAQSFDEFVAECDLKKVKYSSVIHKLINNYIKAKH